VVKADAESCVVDPGPGFPRVLSPNPGPLAGTVLDQKISMILTEKWGDFSFVL